MPTPRSKPADGTRDSAGLAGTLEAAVNRAALTEALGGQLPDDELERALASARSDRVKREVHRQVDALAVATESHAAGS
jgi:hypothetical protein